MITIDPLPLYGITKMEEFRSEQAKNMFERGNLL
jgi:hypothetical protein